MAAYELPSVFRGGKPVDRDREEAEILAQSFSIAAGSLFERLVAQEGRIADLVLRMAAAKKYMMLSAIIGVIILIIGIGAGFQPVIIIIGLAMFGVAGYIYFMSFKQSEKDIKKSETIKRNLRPDYNLDYISKIHVPLYLIPYSEGVIVFDSNSRGREFSVNLVNLRSDQIDEGIKLVGQSAARYSKLIAPNNVMEASFVERYNRTVFDSKIFEKEIVDSLTTLEAATSKPQWLKESFKFRLHTPETSISSGIKNAYPFIRAVTSPSMVTGFGPMPSEFMIETVEKLRGVESESRSSNIFELVNIWQNRVNHIVTPIDNILGENISLMTANQIKFHKNALFTTTRQVCKECLVEANSKKDMNLKVKYDLKNFITEKFRASIEVMDAENKCPRCGRVVELLADSSGIVACPYEDCAYEGNSSDFVKPHEKAKAMIDENIKVDMKGLPMKGVFNLPQLTKEIDGWPCPRHKKGSIENLYFASDVFSHTGDALWKEMQEPIRRSVNEANKFATQNRQKRKDQNLALAPLRSLYTSLETELDKLETQLLEAEKIMETLRRGF